MSAHQRLPRYLRILAGLRADALAGVHKDRLPPETELASRYGVARATLRRAIAALVEEGILEPRQGAGTFVRADGGQTRTIAMVVSPALAGNADDPWMQQISYSLLLACARRGWTLRLAASPADMGVRLAAGRGAPVAACVAVAFQGYESDQLSAIPVPLVLAFCEPLRTAPCVLPESAPAVAGAVARLAALGHREIVHHAGPVKAVVTARERCEGYLQGMAAAGLAVRDGAVIESAFNIEDGYRSMGLWWSRPVRPTAVVCANDQSAIGVMRWLVEHGMLPGREVSVVGYDGLTATRLAAPALSSLEVDFPAFAEAVMDLVLDAERAGIRRSPVRLVERASMGPAPGRA